MTAGLQFQASYTWGHALADGGTTLSGSNGLYNISATNYGLSYSSASWDIRQSFVSSFNYDLPFGRGQHYGANMFQRLPGGKWGLRTGVDFRQSKRGTKWWTHALHVVQHR